MCACTVHIPLQVYIAYNKNVVQFLGLVWFIFFDSQSLLGQIKGGEKRWVSEWVGGGGKGYWRPVVRLFGDGPKKGGGYKRVEEEGWGGALNILPKDRYWGGGKGELEKWGGGGGGGNLLSLRLANAPRGKDTFPSYARGVESLLDVTGTDYASSPGITNDETERKPSIHGILPFSQHTYFVWLSLCRHATSRK